MRETPTITFLGARLCPSPSLHCYRTSLIQVRPLRVPFVQVPVRSDYRKETGREVLIAWVDSDHD